MKGPTNFYIRTISPVHIGCDEVYEPTGFVLNENVRQMVVFDPLSFISQMDDDDKAEFSQICAKGTISSILEIYKFMQDKTVDGRVIDVCPDFLKHYQQTLSLPMRNAREIQQNLNSFAIPRTAFRSVDQRPYIPGSAIKGALRTAYLNLMESEKKLSARGKERNARNLEQRLMEYDGIPTDPFRMVKVSDFTPVGETRTRIVYGVNKKKKPSDRDARGLPLIFEVIPPGSVFVGTISVNSPLPGSDIRKAISMGGLLNSSGLFYTDEKKREEKELSNIGVEVVSDEGRLQDPNNSFLARVGRHSGAESVTIEGHRDIFIMGKRGERKYLNHATTFWLVSETRNPVSMNNLQPFGWVQLGEVTNDQSKEFAVREQEWKNNEAKRQKIRHEEAEKQLESKRKAEEEAKQRELVEEEKRKEEERKKAELEKMSPEERDIMVLSDPYITEQQVIEIYNRIDSFSEENKKQAALSLRTYWDARAKWKKKTCSKKQWVKVQKIKAILGDE
ncbi:MAG: type III-A CRISPR-associated RAMP protein Csm5 [Thermodesulfobacteriota bacterium]|nr:type III-A CRISPR-associated RAMP protein Csm5 [Thermodesulfobacteriota bacterium]